MAYVHVSVTEACRSMLLTDGRYAYTTPKSFLEQIQLFLRLLERETNLLTSKVERLENGLDRLRLASIQVDELKGMLAIQEVELKSKNEEAERLIQVTIILFTREHIRVLLTELIIDYFFKLNSQ